MKNSESVLKRHQPSSCINYNCRRLYSNFKSNGLPRVFFGGEFGPLPLRKYVRGVLVCFIPFSRDGGVNVGVLDLSLVSAKRD